MDIVTSDDIKKALSEAMEITHIEVETYEGQDHFTATVVSPDFAGRSRVQQHKMVYAPLKKPMEGAIHALELTTWTPLEWEDKQKNETVTKADAMRLQEDKIEKKDK